MASVQSKFEELYGKDLLSKGSGDANVRVIVSYLDRFRGSYESLQAAFEFLKSKGEEIPLRARRSFWHKTPTGEYGNTARWKSVIRAMGQAYMRNFSNRNQGVDWVVNLKKECKNVFPNPFEPVSLSHFGGGCGSQPIIPATVFKQCHGGEVNTIALEDEGSFCARTS